MKTSAYLYHFKTKKDDHERRRIKGYWDISATFFFSQLTGAGGGGVAFTIVTPDTPEEKVDEF